MEQQMLWAIIIIGAVLFIGILSLIIKMYQKAVQGEALVRTGL